MFECRVRDKELHDGFLDDHQSYDLNDDKLLDEMEPAMVEGFKVEEKRKKERKKRWPSVVATLNVSCHLCLCSSVLYCLVFREKKER